VSSAAAKGAYYKLRTKRFLEAQGYQVGFLERVLFIHTAKGRVPIKRDQFGSDLLALNATRIVFVQVKGGRSRHDQLAAARRAFAAFAFPPGTEQWIVLWAPRARRPEIEVVSRGPCGHVAALAVPRRDRRRDLPLFAGAR
jgi:hypothetical protein